MATKYTDVDIDCFGRERILEGLPCTAGRIDRPDGSFERHNTGVYFQDIPRDPVTNTSTLDHRIAHDYGYFKVDFLNINFYEGVRSESHLNQLLSTEPPWDFFLFPDVTDQLFQLRGHSDLLKHHQPKSVEELAMILAIIRPGKAHLQKKSWAEIAEEVWVRTPGDDTYQFKRAHGIAYALAIVVNLNLLVEKMTSE